MSIRDLLIGRPLASVEEGDQRVGPITGIPMLGLDALSSAAYGPEAALTLLLPLGAAGLGEIGPLTGVIVGLLLIVYFSYQQTIAAYPSGGGSYIVARENLGVLPGLLAAAALLLDYVLVVAVGISAGVGALVSAVPSLQPHTLAICLGILVAIAAVNLRGVRESGLAFVVPTYVFVASLLGVIAVGYLETWRSQGHPVPVVAPAALPLASSAVSVWLLLRAFASGCTAMTGVEAVSNGVSAFRAPAVTNARRTLTAIIGVLVVLLLGIALLCRAYHIGATEPDSSGYQSVLSAILLVIFGGITDRLIPLFAIGAFLAFTLSQAGMVAHWRRHGGPHRSFSAMVNGVGALATGITLAVVPIAKFAEGAWVMTLLVPALLFIFGGVRRHYDAVAAEIATRTPLDCVEVPTAEAHLPMPRLVTIASPYRHVFNPLLNYIIAMKDAHPDRQVAVLIPELVARHWYQHLLHSKRAAMLKAVLLLRGGDEIVVINVPWYLTA